MKLDDEITLIQSWPDAAQGLMGSQGGGVLGYSRRVRDYARPRETWRGLPSTGAAITTGGRAADATNGA